MTAKTDHETDGSFYSTNIHPYIPFLIITPPLHLVAEVIEDCGQVGLREGVGGVGDEEPRLAHLPVPAHHALDVLHLAVKELWPL